VRLALLAVVCIFGANVVLNALGGAAFADQIYWLPLLGDWSNLNNWADKTVPPTSGNVNVVPGASDSAYVTIGGQAQITGSAFASTLYVGGGSTLSLTGSLSTSDESVGYTGAGAITQTSGTNSTYWLDIGSGSSGAYGLSGGGLTATYEYVGDSGNGTFNQTGGTNNVTELMVGAYTTGSYTLGGAGSLSVSDNEYVGYSGTGTFTQTGGTHTVVGTLTLAAYAGSSGTYNLQGGTLTAGAINVNSGGTFNVTGGNLSASGGMTISSGGVLTGIATVGANVSNSGNVSPGSSTNPGTLTINGNYSQSGALNIGINGTSASGNFGSLAISGTASLGGSLNVALGSGFQPVDGDIYKVLSASSASGTFNNGSHIVQADNSSGNPTNDFFKVNYNNGASLLAITAQDVLNGAVNVSLGNNGTQITATFTPKLELSLKEAATVCGVTGFNWQQTIDVWPAPSHLFAASSPTVPLTTPPAFLDPVAGGYTYEKGGDNSYPFYYDPNVDLPGQETTNTLSFSDTPADPDLAKNPALFLEFTTSLVGVLPGNLPGPTLYTFTWIDTFDGTVGGVEVTKNILPVDAGSGTGGITIVSQGIPEPATLAMLVVGVGMVLSRRR
jgi:hypothetical protein